MPITQADVSRWCEVCNLRGTASFGTVLWRFQVNMDVGEVTREQLSEFYDNWVSGAAPHELHPVVTQEMQ